MSSELRLEVSVEKINFWEGSPPNPGAPLCSACNEASATRYLYVRGPYPPGPSQLIGYLCNWCGVTVINQATPVEPPKQEGKLRRIVEVE